MTKLFLLITIMLWSLGLNAQSNYSTAVQQSDEAFQKGTYDITKKKPFVAEAFNQSFSQKPALKNYTQENQNNFLRKLKFHAGLNSSFGSQAPQELALFLGSERYEIEDGYRAKWYGPTIGLYYQISKRFEINLDFSLRGNFPKKESPFEEEIYFDDSSIQFYGKFSDGYRELLSSVRLAVLVSIYDSSRRKSKKQNPSILIQGIIGLEGFNADRKLSLRLKRTDAEAPPIWELYDGYLHLFKENFESDLSYDHVRITSAYFNNCLDCLGTIFDNKNFTLGLRFTFIPFGNIPQLGVFSEINRKLSLMNIGVQKSRYDVYDSFVEPLSINNDHPEVITYFQETWDIGLEYELNIKNLMYSWGMNIGIMVDL